MRSGKKEEEGKKDFDEYDDDFEAEERKPKKQGFSGDNSQGGSEDDSNISWEERNRKNVVPLRYRKTDSSNRHGHNGAAVVVPDELKDDAKRLFKIHQFNLVASDLVPKDRELPDIRSAECKQKHYDVASLPSTSVVIVFHNEAWSTLIRTIWSVINHSPPSLLKEIVLVDDASFREFLKEPLEEYIKKLPVPVLLERMGNRSGLVQSRLKGASVASGATLTFLDAHCECTSGWLEPLLYQVHFDRKSVVSPLIDVITSDSMEYRFSIVQHSFIFFLFLSYNQIGSNRVGWFQLENGFCLGIDI